MIQQYEKEVRSMPELIKKITRISEKLANFPSCVAMNTRTAPQPMPSLFILSNIMESLKGLFFPAYFAKESLQPDSLSIHMAANLETVYRLLAEQIVAGLCFECANGHSPCINCEQEGKEKAIQFITKLPYIRELLESDAIAAYEGDPAAKSVGETIFCYPSLTAMIHHRIAHELYKLQTPVIPRIIAEMAHSVTGIDIHPGAAIGKNFFIDHGTGVVIGETSIVGDSCRIYQGVTLGALSFPKNFDGTLQKGILRHPVLEDNVTVYAGATILGRITIGKNSVIGGNTWITESIPPDSVITQKYKE